jgi:hypothetical protein
MNAPLTIGQMGDSLYACKNSACTCEYTARVMQLKVVCCPEAGRDSECLDPAIREGGVGWLAGGYIWTA